MTVGIGNELVRHVREVLRHQSGEVSIFSEGQQVLLVQSINGAVTVVADNSVRDNQWFAFVSGSETVHGETVTWLESDEEYCG